MRYLPTIDLWAPGIQAAITRGQIRIQPGQWVYCGRKYHKSRFVSATPDGRFNVVHWQGSGRATRIRFNNRIFADKLGKLYQVDKNAWRQVTAIHRAYGV